jgi:hypothetical protein
MVKINLSRSLVCKVLQAKYFEKHSDRQRPLHLFHFICTVVHLNCKGQPPVDKSSYTILAEYCIIHIGGLHTKTISKQILLYILKPMILIAPSANFLTLSTPNFKALTPSVD